MEQVELRVKVLDAELSNLEQRINKIKNTTVSVKSSGMEAAAEGFKKGAKELKNFSDAATDAGKSSESLMQNISKFTTWYMIGGAVSGVIRSFKDAAAAMKEVDSALATVQKVTGESEAVIKRLGDTAYETASKYGVAAKDFLAAAGDFAKAGYDNYGAMAELATKVQLVGDVTADTASQFILSANAAWKMEGNITRLSAVLDAANEIENNYATSIEKIADGLPIVASTAANANMSMEEVIASLGTITAVTQESGTKAATALRALILNLQGAVGEYEEGFQVTEESVQSLNGLLNIYAADAMKAADAAGKIINPLEAIAALSKAADEGLLNQAELFDLLSGLGGKLRTNQLTALVTNFDMLSSMLETVETSAGSAERELDVMLDTWEAKTNILKNTWTEFISHLLDTNTVKGGIDALIAVIEFLDGDLAKFTATVGGTAVAVALLGKVIKGVNGTTLISALKGMLSSTEALKAGVSLLTETMLSSPIFWGAAVAASIFGIVKLFDALTLSADELKEKLEDVNAELLTQQDEIEALESKGIENLTEAERVRLSVLREQTSELAKQRAELARQTLDVYKNSRSGYKGAVENDILGYVQVDLSNQQYAHSLLNTAAAAGNLNVLTGEQRIVLSEYITELLNAKEAIGELEEAEEGELRLYRYLSEGTKSAAKETENLTGSISKASDAVTAAGKRAEETQRKIEALQAQTKAVSGALQEFSESGTLTKDTLDDLDAVFPGLTSAILDNKGALTEEAKAALDTSNSFIELIAKEAVFNNSNLDVTQKLEALRQLAIQAGITGASLSFIGGGSAETARKLSAIEGYGLSRADAETLLVDASYNNLIRALDEDGTTNPPPSVGGGGKATDPELDRRKGIVSLLKSELALYKERGDAQDVQIAKMREIQNALHDEAEYMRSIGASQEDINGLSEEWWKYENQIKDLQEEIIEDQKKQIENVKSLIEVYYKEQNTALNEQKDALEAARDAEEDRLTLAEKQLAVEKARAALENAQKERTIRQYNAATGQWEWVADQKTVESARSAYEKALKDLSDFQSDLEFQRQKAEIEQRIKLNENAASALENAIQVYIDAMLSGSDKTGEAFETLIETLKGANGLSDQLREQIIISLMKANAANWLTASDEMKAQLHGYNDQLGALIGANYNSRTGYWMKNGMRLFALDESATYETLGLAGSGGAGGSGIVISQGGLVNGNAPAGLPVGTVVQTAGGDFKIVAPGTEGARYNAESGYWSLKVHDIGGVLKGVGGIKATNEDELVLPPDITRKMLTPTLDANTRARFAELRYLYGGNKLAGVGGTSIGSQHNGNIYNLNGVNITERQAKATSVYDFVRMSQGLSIYNSTN